MNWQYQPKKRGRQSAEEVEEQEAHPSKFTRVYEDEFTIETWKFDLKKFDKGPIEIDIKYKAGAEKALKQMIKEARKSKKIAKQMKKMEGNSTKSKRKILL